MIRVHRAIPAAYLSLQAVGIAAWWLWLANSAEGRSKFSPAGSENALVAFAGGDLLLLAILAVAAAAGIWHRAKWTGPVLWLHSGAAAYASCWAFSLAVLEPARTIGALMMAPLLVASLAVACWWSCSAAPHAKGGA